MTGFEGLGIWNLLRPHLLQLGCPTSAPDAASSDEIRWDLDPVVPRDALGWSRPGVVRIGRGFAMGRRMEARWAAYELALPADSAGTEPSVPVAFVIESFFGPDASSVKATLLSSPADAHDSMYRWADECGLRGSSVTWTEGADGHRPPGEGETSTR